ncbi:MAG: bacteriohemerythrin [Bacteroidetes bacterium]|nr:bacteriohemerythrin [Bacteroidota bacterium]
MVEKIAWDEFFLVGVEEIDVQHKHMVELVNKAVIRANEYQEREELAPLLEDLWFYAKWHFSCEESLMKILGYPEADSHQKIHNELLDELDDKVEKVLEGYCDLQELRDFLFDWLGRHAHKEDRDLGAFVTVRWN